MKSIKNTDTNSSKPAVETRSQRIARLIVEGNKRSAEVNRQQMAKHSQPPAQRQFISKAAMLLNQQGGHKMPVGAVAIADYNRAKLDPTTSAPTAPKATTKPKVKLTLADRIKRLTPAARAEMKRRLDLFNAGKSKAATKSKPTVEATVKPMKATAKPAAPAPVSTVKISKAGRWSVALGRLANLTNLTLGKASL
jgi:hypothetical protein